MRTLNWLILGAAAIAISSGCRPAERPAPLRLETRAWTDSGRPGSELRTDHFVIRTTLADDRLRDVLPGFMEAAFSEYQKLLVPDPARDEVLPIYLFETREEWARFTRHFDTLRADTYLHIQAGGYTDYRTGIAAAFDIGRDRTLALLAHEGFHQYAARYLGAPLPAWLNEGLATQFEAFELEDGRPRFTPERNLLRVGSLREALTLPDGMIPIGELLAMNAGDAVRKTGQPVRVFYAQLWSTILYLRDPQSPYGRGFQRLLADAGTPRLAATVRSRRETDGADEAAQTDARIVFRHYITSDLELFANRYRVFARKLVY